MGQNIGGLVRKIDVTLENTFLFFLPTTENSGDFEVADSSGQFLGIVADSSNL